jgi:hypothetical protein
VSLEEHEHDLPLTDDEEKEQQMGKPFEAHIVLRGEANSLSDVRDDNAAQAAWDLLEETEGIEIAEARTSLRIPGPDQEQAVEHG